MLNNLTAHSHCNNYLNTKYNRLEKRFGADLIVVSADDPTDIGGVVGCYIISVTILTTATIIQTCTRDTCGHSRLH